MFPRIHDTQVVAYSADSRLARVELVLRDGPSEDAPVFQLVFSGVAAHRFEHPLMPSWVFDLEEIPAEELLSREWENFQQGTRLTGWPGTWAESLEKALTYCKEQGLRGFDLESSYGFDGWVLAQSVELTGGA